MKPYVLIIACLAHILCGATDCLLSYSKKARLDLKQIKDPVKMAEMLEGMPLWQPLASMLLGTLAITLFGFGYLETARYIGGFSHIAGTILYVSALFFIVPIVTHHVFCGAVEWIFIKLGRTCEAHKAVMEMQKKTIPTMFAGYISLVVFLVTLFAAVVSGKTGLPQWSCVFNTLVFMILMLPTRIPAKGNAAGALMFAGLTVMTLI